MSRRRLAKTERKTPNLHLLLNETERDALDAGAEKFGVELQTYVRTLILAAHSGELPIAPTMFEAGS
jgi:prolyl-tRNA editing enzyme YbaK/EbsC (Cys-tRNA(Pro) deacylase)